jgi:hypothetical protein
MSNTSTKDKSTERNKDFIEFIHSYKSKVSQEPLKCYFPADTVVDAWQAGVENGQKESREKFFNDLVEKYFDKLLNAYSQLRGLIIDVKDKGFEIDNLFVNPKKPASRFLISVKDKLLLDDKFIELIYPMIADITAKHQEKFNEYIDISLVGNEDLDVELLKSDGYIYDEKSARAR